MKLRNRESMIVLGGFLGAVALSAALVLAVVSQLTSQPIKDAQARVRQAVFYRLSLPEFDSVEKDEIFDGIKFTPVARDGKICGFVGQGSGSGYGGAIEVMVGFSPEGTITGVQILQHKETPGLGANVCDRKFQRTIFNLNETAPEVPSNIYLDQFSGKKAVDAGVWKISKDGGSFNYMTGATVSCRAVTGTVNRIAQTFSLWRKDK